MSSVFYVLRASDELASSRFGGILATPSLLAGFTKQSVFGHRALVLACDQRAAQCVPCELAVPIVTLADSGKAPGLLTSGSLFHRCRARQLSGHRAQNAVISKQSGGAQSTARMPAPQFKISIYLSPLSTSDYSSCPWTGRIACLRSDVISFRSLRSFCLSLLGLPPRPTRSSSFRSSSVHPCSVASSPSLGVSVHAS